MNAYKKERAYNRETCKQVGSRTTCTSLLQSFTNKINNLVTKKNKTPRKGERRRNKMVKYVKKTKKKIPKLKEKELKYKYKKKKKVKVKK